MKRLAVQGRFIPESRSQGPKYSQQPWLQDRSQSQACTFVQLDYTAVVSEVAQSMQSDYSKQDLRHLPKY